MIESYRAIYFEDDIGLSQEPREIVFKEHPVFIHVPIASGPISSHIVDQHPVATTDDEPIKDVDPVAPNVDLVAPDVVIVTPQTRGSVDYPSTRGIQVDVELPNATSENRAESPLYGELYPNTIHV